MSSSKPNRTRGFTDEPLPSLPMKLWRHILFLWWPRCDPKYISFVYDGKKSTTSGFIRDITSGPTNFLGQLQISSYRSNSCEAGKMFIELSNRNWNQVHARGEYKLELSCALLPLCHMAVDCFPQRPSTKCKQLFSSSCWSYRDASPLQLSTTWMWLTPPPRTKAKLTFLSSTSTWQDPLIKEILSILTDEEYCKNQRISIDLLLKGKSSISTVSSKSPSSHCRRELREMW